MPCSVSKRSASAARHYILLNYMLGTALIELLAHRPVWVSWGCLLTCINSPFSSSLREADCERHNPAQKAMTVSAKRMVNQRAVISSNYPQRFHQSGCRLSLRYLLAGEITGLEFGPFLASSSWLLKSGSSPSSSFALAMLKFNTTVCNEPPKAAGATDWRVFFLC